MHWGSNPIANDMDNILSATKESLSDCLNATVMFALKSRDPSTLGLQPQGPV